MRHVTLIIVSVLLWACASSAPKSSVESTDDGNYRISDDSDDAVALAQKLEDGARSFCDERGGDVQVVDREQRTIYRSMEGYHRLTLIFRCTTARSD